MELFSGPHSAPDSEIVGHGTLHGMPGERIHCKTIEEHEFSVQVGASLKDDYDLKYPIVEEEVLVMNQAIGYIIRWPASDLRRADIQHGRPAAPPGSESQPTEEVLHYVTRAGSRKLKSVPEEKKPKSYVKGQEKAKRKQDDAFKVRKRVAFPEQAVEVRSPPPSSIKPAR